MAHRNYEEINEELDSDISVIVNHFLLFRKGEYILLRTPKELHKAIKDLVEEYGSR